MQKEIPRGRWLTDAAVTLSPVCLFHISCFHREKKKKRRLTEDRTEQKRQKEERRFLPFRICSVVAAGDLISAKT